jgi:diacylglycerol kinase (ATP)
VTGELALVVNPTAGAGRGAALLGPVTTRLRAANLPVRVLQACTAAAATQLCRTAVATGASAVVALGGDGTVHLALQAVAGTATPLGIVAAGTGNDIARCLGLPLDPLAATDALARAAVAGHATAFDVARATPADGAPRWWAGVLGAGFDSAVNERANRLRWPRGRRRYDLAIAAELARLRPVYCTVEVDDVVVEGPVTFVAVGNAPAYGGGMRICPAADLTDGLLDVTIVGPITRRGLLRVKPRVYAGTHVQHPAVRTLRGRRVRVAAAGVVAYVDGERLGPLPVTATCVSGAVRVLGGVGRD